MVATRVIEAKTNTVLLLDEKATQVYIGDRMRVALYKPHDALLSIEQRNEI